MTESARWAEVVDEGTAPDGYNRTFGVLLCGRKIYTFGEALKGRAEMMGRDINRILSAVAVPRAVADRMAEALRKLRDCNWTITLPDRMDAVRDIAREALEAYESTATGGDGCVVEYRDGTVEKITRLGATHGGNHIGEGNEMIRRLVEAAEKALKHMDDWHTWGADCDRMKHGLEEALRPFRRERTPIPESDIWKCQHCGHDESWFDRSITFYKDGSEDGMKTRCVKCGMADDDPVEERKTP